MKTVNQNLKAGALRSKISGFIRRTYSSHPAFNIFEAKIVDGRLTVIAYCMRYPDETKRDARNAQAVWDIDNTVIKAVHAEFGGELSTVKRTVYKGYSDQVQSIRYERVLKFRKGR